MPTPTLLAGIDLGGTKIEGVVVDGVDPSRVLCRLRAPTHSELGYENIIERIGGVVDEMRGKIGAQFPTAIGIGTPGTLDPATGTLRGSNTSCLNGKPILTDLEAHLGMNVQIANDANCFALAESRLGAGRGYPTVFGIIMGTGCGGCYVVGDRALNGRHGIAGEWGQVVIEPNGELSPHGSRGTVEAYIAGPALEAFYERTANIRRTLRDIASRTDDAAANATMERLQEYFARSLAVIINTFDPHAIVVGGGVGNLDVVYSESTRQRIAALVFAPSFEAPILKPSLGDSAGVFGAALLGVTGSEH